MAREIPWSPRAHGHAHTCNLQRETQKCAKQPSASLIELWAASRLSLRGGERALFISSNSHRQASPQLPRLGRPCAPQFLVKSAQQTILSVHPLRVREKMKSPSPK